MSVFLIEQLITGYSQILLSNDVITVSKTRLINESSLDQIKLKFKSINGKGYFCYCVNIYITAWILISRNDLEHKINMKLVNIFVPSRVKSVLLFVILVSKYCRFSAQTVLYSMKFLSVKMILQKLIVFHEFIEYKKIRHWASPLMTNGRLQWKVFSFLMNTKKSIT